MLWVGMKSACAATIQPVLKPSQPTSTLSATYIYNQCYSGASPRAILNQLRFSTALHLNRTILIFDKHNILHVMGAILAAGMGEHMHGAHVPTHSGICTHRQ